jgi:hypothetical protein
MKDEKDEGLPLMLDPSAAAAEPSKPAFLSKPPGAPVYHGFPLVPETCIDGWCYGAITSYKNPKGCNVGDGYVQAPDGSRAGLVWEVGQDKMSEILPPGPGRWGVYAVWFPKPVRNVVDLRDCFAHVLPQLRTCYERLKSQHERSGT